KNEIIKKNLIRSKNNNIDFFISLGEMIVGDNDCFPPKSSMNITKFFEDSGFPGYKYNGDTKKFWVAKILESLDIDDLYRVIQNLFKRKYFIKSGKDIGVAKSNFKDFIESSLNADELPDLSDVFDLNINTDLLFNEDVETSDGVLNSDIEAARELFIQGNLQLANEKIWDALERVKSLYDKDKKKSVNSIVRVLSDELTDKNNKEKAPLQDYIFNLELRCLTDIGNSYKIRHSEDGQKVIENEETKRYLFFRCLNLINLVLKRMS
ncbi:MAG TPA: hypothetical protein DCL21_04155, partial [Alphaproteobacteria bacterium]|nr:hypothetical protein [Alphaproteobacteria bacterium]